QSAGGRKRGAGLPAGSGVRPGVLLRAEPLSALDAQTRELLMDDLVRLSAAERFAGVYVTHNLAEAVRLGHRIIVLSRRPGRVRAVIEITRPIAVRGSGDPDLDARAREIWALARAAAAAAARELLHGGRRGARSAVSRRRFSAAPASRRRHRDPVCAHLAVVDGSAPRLDQSDRAAAARRGHRRFGA